MKCYVISGLGADFKVLEKLEFNEHIEVIFLNWLIPHKNETFPHYVQRMASRIDSSEDFYLLGYSFGGIIAQEIHKKIKPAKKVVILGSIRSNKEKSALIRIGKITKIPKILPLCCYGSSVLAGYAVVRKLIDPKNPKILEYFRVRDPYYLKWSIEKICDWKFSEDPNIIQILGDRDIVFPIKNTHPDYIIKGGTHLFPLTKHKEVSQILKTLFI